MCAERQAALIAQWMNVGFIHGVMNTDNMAISGETIDYGPCAFMEAYDPATVFSSIDHQGRYAFGNQPNIACWNLARLAETLLPLLSDDPEEAVAMATEVHRCVPGAVPQAPASRTARQARAASSRTGRRRRRYGAGRRLVDVCFMPSGWISPSAWRRLADAAAGDEAPLRALFADARAPDAWLARWQARCASESASAQHGSAIAGIERANAMRSVNPYVIARNHRVEEALAAASDQDDLAPFERLLEALRQPYDETPELAPYAEPAPAAVTACYRTFCGT